MKKTITLILAVILSITVYGQNVYTIIYDSWTSGSWANSSKHIFTYDVNDYLIKTQIQRWDAQTNSYKIYSQVNYTNNSNGTIQQSIFQIWDNGTSSWNNLERKTYTYNVFDKPLTVTYEGWQSGSWQNLKKYFFTYDNNGYLTYELRQNWDTPISSFQNGLQFNYTNNENGTVQYYIEQTWNNETNSWDNSKQATYTYNAFDKPLTIITDKWTNGNWENYNKQTNTYDANGYLTNSLHQSWVNSTNSYQNFTQINYTNNADGTLHQRISQIWINSTNSWNNLDRGTYIYTNTVDVCETDEVQFTLFPNPGTDNINISLERESETTISVVDMQGKLIMTERFVGSQVSIDVKGIPSGIYLLIVQSDGKTGTTKFVKD
jgi:hypothetical protein